MLIDPTCNSCHFPSQLTYSSIVAVHGLHPLGSDTNAFSTWTAERDGEKRNWLQHAEFLPAAVPTGRIMVFSYNSNAIFQASSATVNDHAINLLEMLRQKRRKASPFAPTFTVTTSFRTWQLIGPALASAPKTSHLHLPQSGRTSSQEGKLAPESCFRSAYESSLTGLLGLMSRVSRRHIQIEYLRFDQGDRLLRDTSPWRPKGSRRRRRRDGPQNLIQQPRQQVHGSSSREQSLL